MLEIINYHIKMVFQKQLFFKICSETIIIIIMKELLMSVYFKYKVILNTDVLVIVGLRVLVI